MKKITLTLEDLFNLPTAVIYNPDSFHTIYNVSIDSRNIKKSSLFIAIKGGKFDGHNFIKDAVGKGASALMINKRKLKDLDDFEIPVITVEDTIKALGDLAKVWRNKFEGKVIGITGSNGKTSTKEILAVLLSEKFKINKTIANNNNHIGVPLTILSTTEKHTALICELGTNHFGEIEYTSNILKPDYALITNIGNSHIEFLKNKKGVLKEKKALFESTVSNNGILFINNDDVFLRNIFSKYPKRITYGFDDNSNVTAQILGYDEKGKAEIKIRSNKKTIKNILPVYGEANAKNYLASTAVALKLGLTKAQILNGTKKLSSVEKRLTVKKLKNIFLIDDSYNANPESMKYSLELLGRIKLYKKKIAVLGDMFELGIESKKLHESLVKEIKKNKIDAVYTIGNAMKYLDNRLSAAKIDHKHFNSREKLKNILKKDLLQNSTVLVKGSRGMKMEEFVKSIISITEG